jgi:exonuclease SbcC
MQINRIRLCNFRQHENTELELGAGLTGIIGPNGAGKTTILEAIAWSMYGMPAARGSRETIRRRGAPPRAKVEVEMEFTLGPHQYRVLRSLNSAELYQDGDPAPIANSLGAVTERVTRLLGMTREEFVNTYFTGQKELAVMAAMSAPERAQFLSRVLGYERLRAAQERLKERRSLLRARLDTLRAGLIDLPELDAAEQRARERVAVASSAESVAAGAFATAERRLLEVRPRWEQAQELREGALALDAEVRISRHQLSTAAERTDRLERQVEEAAVAARQLEELTRRLEPLPVLREEAQALDRQAESWAARKGLLAQLAEVRNHVGSVEERMGRIPSPAAIEGARERVSDLRASLTGLALDAEAARTAWVQDAQDARTKRQGLIDQYQELKEQRQRIVRAGPEGDCPTCTRPLGTEYGTVLQLLDRQIEEVVSNGNFYKQRIEQLQAEPRDLEELDRRRIELERELSAATGELGRLDAQAQEAGRLREEHERLSLRTRELEASLELLLGSYDQGRHQAVLGQIRELEPLALRAERLRVLVDRGIVLTAELETARAERAGAAARTAQLESRLAELGYSEAMYRDARDAETTAERTRREAVLALVRARGA